MDLAKKEALKYGADILEFPVVVKPKSGSVSRHVTTNIKSKEELSQAISKALIYSPAFIVEKFVEDSFVYRATVVDFNFVAVVKQVPTNIIGDGISDIKQLVENKNREEGRDNPKLKKSILVKILIDKTSHELLGKKSYTLNTVPLKNEVIYLQKDPFLKLGGDLIEVTSEVHPETLKLFRDIAKFFDIRLVGIDFLIPNIKKSYEGQSCAVLELNSMPCIEMHHFPSSGEPQNVASALVDLFFKYYL